MSNRNRNNDKMADLSRKLVKLSRFRWEPGMVARTATGQVEVVTSVVVHPDGSTEPAHGTRLLGRDAVPVLDHPATKGWLLELVQRAWPERPAHVVLQETHVPMAEPRREWVCKFFCNQKWWHVPSDTEVEALVAALEVTECPTNS